MRFIVRCAFGLALFTALAHGESREVAELKSQIDQGKAEIASLIRSRDAMAAQLARLSNITAAASARSADERAANLDAIMAGTEAARRIAGDVKVAVGVAETRESVKAIDRANRIDDLVRVNQSNNGLLYGTLITSLSGLALGLGGFAWRYFTDERKHRWSMETTSQAAFVAAQNHIIELAEIAEAKSSARAAYTEANNVNMKIATIGLQLQNGELIDPAKQRQRSRRHTEQNLPQTVASEPKVEKKAK